MLLKLLQGIIDGFVAVLQGIISVLPGSPFNGLSAMTLDSKWFGVICYVVPVPQIVAVLEAWIIAVGTFYLYQVILRWVKAVGD